MAAIDTRPQVVDITHYGGDTLTIKVTAPESLTTGMVWNAQVRTSRTGTTTADATFTITPPNPPTDPAAYLVLKAADCRRLIGTGAVVQKRMGAEVRAIQTYKGSWDCEIKHPTNPDPVTTLVQGQLNLELDVTRTP